MKFSTQVPRSGRQACRLWLALLVAAAQFRTEAQTSTETGPQVAGDIHTLRTGPASNGGCGTAGGYSYQDYFVPGPPSYQYVLSAQGYLNAGTAPWCFAPAFDTCDSNPNDIPCSTYTSDAGYFSIWRFNPGSGDYVEIYSGSLAPDQADLDPCDCFMETKYGVMANSGNNLVVQGTDVIEVQYASSGEMSEYFPTVGFNSVGYNNLVAGPQAVISFSQPQLPANGGWEFTPGLTHPGNFDFSQWKFTEGTSSLGCSIDPDTGMIVTGTQTGTIHVKCFEDVNEPFAGCLNYPQAISKNYVTLDIPIAAEPEIQYVSGINYAGGPVRHHVHFSVTSLGVFNNGQVHWSIDTSDPQYASTLGCFFTDGPNGTSTLTLGDFDGTILLKAEDPSTGYYVEATFPINAEPFISVDRVLAPHRQAIAWVSDLGAFGHISWSISSRIGASDCGISTDGSGDGIIQAGNNSGTITIRATDTTDGYYVEDTEVIEATPTVQPYLGVTGGGGGNGLYYPACLIAGDQNLLIVLIGNEDEVLEFTPSDYQAWGSLSDYSVTLLGGPAGCQIFSYSLGGIGIYPGNTAGTVTIRVQDTYDGWSFTQSIPVRPAASMSFLDNNGILSVPAIGAWGGTCRAQLSGDFEGGVGWNVHDSFGSQIQWPDNPPDPPPHASVNANIGSLIATLSTGTGWSTMPYSFLVLGYDPGVINYGAWGEPEAIPLRRPTNPSTDGPYPVILMSDPIVPTGGTRKCIASVLHLEQMNFEEMHNGGWFLSSAPADCTLDFNPNDGSLIITPGNTPGQIVFGVSDPIVQNYIATAVVTIDRAQMDFDKTLLIADNQTHTVANLPDTSLFPSVGWSIASGPAGVRLTPNGASCVVTAGTAAGTVAVVATSTSGPNSGYSITNTIDIHAVPVVSFTNTYLIPGAHTLASVSDPEAFPSATWSLVSGPPGASVTPAGVVTAGTQTGTIVVQALSPAPNSFTVTGSISSQTLPTITFNPTSLKANSQLHATASVPPGTMTGVIWTVSADPNSTHTFIDPSSGVITAGTQPGTLTIRATDQNNYFVEGSFTINAMAVTFTANPIKADGQSITWAKVQPASAIPGVIWSIRGQKLGCVIIPTTGHIKAGRLPGRIIVRGTDPHSGDYAEGVLELKSDCLASCSTGDCVGGGGGANNNSVDLAISLGYVDYGRTAVTLGFETNNPTSDIVSPKLLWVAGTNSPDVEVIPVSGSDPTIQQVRTPSMLAVVHVVNSSSYTVNLYANDQIAQQSHTPGTPYALIGGATSFCTWTIANPTPGDFTRVRITEARGAKSYVANYTYRTDLGAVGNGWDMTVDGGTRLERRTRTSNPTDNTETFTISDAGTGVEAYREVRNFHVFPWGEEITGFTVGTGPNALSTTLSYYTDSNDTANYGHVSQALLPGGSWETYKYDTQARKIRVVHQFLDNPLPASTADENKNQVTTTTYDDLNNIAEELVTLQGTEISHKYTVAGTAANGDDITAVIQCQNRGVASMTAAGNLATTNYTFPAGSPFEYQPRLLTRPDGTALLFSYSVASGLLTKTVKEGHPNSSYSDVTDGVKTVTVLDDSGNTVSEQQFDIINSSLPLSSKVATARDIFGRPLTYTYGDQSFETMTYTCCGMDSMVNRSGVVTTYDYDNLKRLSLISKAGVTAFSQYNVIGKLASETRMTPGGANTVLHSYQYDGAGRLTQSTDQIGATTIGISTDGSGHKIITTTYPNGSTLVETYYLDGSRLSVSGTSVYPATFQFGVDADGAFKKEIRPRAAATNEWVKASLDMLGRQFKLSYPPNGSGQTPYVQSFYDSVTGQLTKQRDPDGITTLFAYNNRGELFRKAIDIDQNGQISTATDRIEEYSMTYQQQGGTMLVVKHTYVWDNDSGTPARTERLTETTAVDGSYFSSSSFGQATTRTVSYNHAAAQRTETETLPDNTRRVSSYLNDRLISVVVSDATGSQLSAITNGYFTTGAHYGFLQSATDARNGTTSYTYNNADQIATITSPAPGFGQNTPQVTQYSYDELNPAGRVVTTTLPDNSTRIETYQLTGEMKRLSGSSVTPVEYQYEQGRVKTITTWRTYGNDSTAEATTFNYTSDRGFLQSKSYAGAAGPGYTYYDSGRTKTRAWTNGATTTYTYNTAGNLQTVDYSDTTANPDVTYTYTSRGQAKQVVDQTGTTAIQYYSHGLPFTMTHTGGPLNGLVTEYDYDSLLRRQAVIARRNGTEIYRQGYQFNPNDSFLQNITFNGSCAHYDYETNSSLVADLVLKAGSETGSLILTNSRTHNNVGQLEQTSVIGSSTTVSYTSQFNSLNKRQKVTQQDGSYWVYSYDAHGQLQSANKYWSDTTPVAGQQFDYAYDDAGNRLNSQAGGDNSGGNLRTTQYTPNSQNQYTSRNVPGFVDLIGLANPLAAVSAERSQAWRKDNYFCVEVPIDNSLRAVTRDVTLRGVRWDYAGSNDVMTSVSRQVNVPPAHEVFQYYDNGNLKSDGSFTYSWDAENRLTSATQAGQQTVVCAYDYMGRRVQKQVINESGVILSTRTFLYDGWNLLAEFDGNGSVVCSYAWGVDDHGSLDVTSATVPVLINSQSGSMGTYYVAADALGNVAGLFSAADGTQAAAYEYGPFGEPVQASGPAAAACSFRFAAKYYDTETRLVYYGYRYFSPSLGKWLSRDPVEETGGANLYGFVGNDPVNQQDLLGMILFDHSSSYFLRYLGTWIDPRYGYEQSLNERLAFNYASRLSYDILMLPVDVGRALIHPIRTAKNLASIPDLISSGKLKCLLGDKWDEFLRATPEEQASTIADVTFALETLLLGGEGEAGELEELEQVAQKGEDVNQLVEEANAIVQDVEEVAPTVDNSADAARNAQLAENARVGGQWDTYVQETKLKRLEELDQLETQEILPTPELSQPFVKPDYSILNSAMETVAYGDAKAGAIVFDEQAQGFILWAATTPSKTFIYYVPKAVELPPSLLNFASQNGVRIITVIVK